MTTRQRGNDIGPIGERLGDQVRRVRLDRGLTQSELSESLGRLGRPIPTASIGRLESGGRKVDVDDLMAIAYALDVSPLALLLPFTQTPDETIRPAGSVGREMDAASAWQWAVGDAPHRYDSLNRDSQMAEWSEFRGRSKPWWLKVSAPVDERMIATMGRLPPSPAGPDPMYDPQDDDGKH